MNYAVKEHFIYKFCTYHFHLSFHFCFLTCTSQTPKLPMSTYQDIHCPTVYEAVNVNRHNNCMSLETLSMTTYEKFIPLSPMLICVVDMKDIKYLIQLKTLY